METKNEYCFAMWDELVKYVNELDKDKGLNETDKTNRVIGFVTAMNESMEELPLYYGSIDTV